MEPDETMIDDQIEDGEEEALSPLGLLPDWYMPAPAERTTPLPRWVRWVAIAIIAAFLAIDAVGLCSTYGHVGFG